MISTATYTVVGMTCGCCAKSVTEAVNQLDGVTDVGVDVDTGAVTVTVTSATAVDVAAVRAAVEGAGYSVASA